VGITDEALPLERLLGQLRSLTQLTLISIPLADTFKVAEIGRRLSFLRIVRFVCCNKLSLNFLEEFAKALKGNLCWSLFQQLEFINCLNISQEAVKALLPEGKVVWFGEMSEAERLRG
jgi:hypothetical protein